MQGDTELKRVLWYLLGGARGGENRARIIHELNLRPSNLNQLATKLGVDYRTVTHHINVLKKNAIVIAEGEHYGTTYFLSPLMERNLGYFYEICRKLHYKLE
jgi:DNA-binding transcriptional ArsR family regulator